MISLSGTKLVLTIKDLVDFVECPRVVYWSYLQPSTRRANDSLSHDTAFFYKDHYDPILIDLLIQNGLDEIDLKYKVELQNKMLRGKIDVIARNLLKRYPIYIKKSKEMKSLTYFLPIYAYAWLLQDTYGILVDKGFIYYPTRQELEPIRIGIAELAVVEATAESVRNIIVCGTLPDILHHNPRKCSGCNFRRHCNELMR